MPRGVYDRKKKPAKKLSKRGRKVVDKIRRRIHADNPEIPDISLSQLRSTIVPRGGEHTVEVRRGDTVTIKVV